VESACSRPHPNGGRKSKAGKAEPLVTSRDAKREAETNSCSAGRIIRGGNLRRAKSCYLRDEGAIDLNRQREQGETSNCGEPRDPFHGIESEQPAVLPNIRRHDFPLPKGRGDTSRFAFRTGGNSHVCEWISDRCGEPASVSLLARLAATGNQNCQLNASHSLPFSRHSGDAIDREILNAAASGGRIPKE
jgi:hypothetical protein